MSSSNSSEPCLSNMNLYKLDASGLKKLISILTYIFQEYTDKQEGYQEVMKENPGIFFIATRDGKGSKCRPIRELPHQ
jgi:hypothetical protein